MAASEQNACIVTQLSSMADLAQLSVPNTAAWFILTHYQDKEPLTQFIQHCLNRNFSVYSAPLHDPYTSAVYVTKTPVPTLHSLQRLTSDSLPYY